MFGLVFGLFGGFGDGGGGGAISKPVNARDGANFTKKSTQNKMFIIPQGPREVLTGGHIRKFEGGNKVR